MNSKNIKTIIFDFGGVILDIDPQITIKEFQKMGFKDVAKTNSKEFIEDIIRKFERGIYTPEVLEKDCGLFWIWMCQIRNWMTPGTP